MQYTKTCKHDELKSTLDKMILDNCRVISFAPVFDISFNSYGPITECKGYVILYETR